MKSKRIVISFLFLLSLNFYGFEHTSRSNSIFFLQKETAIPKESSDHKNGTNTAISDEGLKLKAIDYAKQKEIKKAFEYAQKQIKRVDNIQILSHPAFIDLETSIEYQNLLSKYKPITNLGLLLLFSCGLLGMFFSVVINLRKKGDRIANLIISLFVFLHSLFIIHLYIYMSRNNYSIGHSLYSTASFSFLFGPLLYFYFKRISEQYIFKAKDLLHLIPAIALFLFLLPNYLLSSETKIHMMFNRSDLLYSKLFSVILLKYASLVIYAVLILRLYKKLLFTEEHPKFRILNWHRNIIILNLLYVFFFILYGFSLLNTINSTNLYFIYPISFFMAVIILYVGYTAYVQPEKFYKRYVLETQNLFKYKKSSLTESYSEELKEELLILFHTQKIYKKNNISLEDLAIKLGTTRHNVSQVINEHFEINFFHLINKYRIKEAIVILQNDPYHNLNIIDVAYDVGFNNKVTFNKAFKSETTMTPSEFIKKNITAKIK